VHEATTGNLAMIKPLFQPYLQCSMTTADLVVALEKWHNDSKRFVYDVKSPPTTPLPRLYLDWVSSMVQTDYGTAKVTGVSDKVAPVLLDSLETKLDNALNGHVSSLFAAFGSIAIAARSTSIKAADVTPFTLPNRTAVVMAHDPLPAQDTSIGEQEHFHF
jgi:hypothetical protein